MAADQSATPAEKRPSPFGGLVIPLLLIAIAGVVYAVFFFLNAKTPPTVPSNTPPTDTAPTAP